MTVPAGALRVGDIVRIKGRVRVTAGATADTHFASYGKSTSFADDYDSFKATVMFESGLSRITSAGGSQSASMTFALRYIELDGGGGAVGLDEGGVRHVAREPAAALGEGDPPAS